MVEFDKDASEPVDVYVNYCLIAGGCVMVIEGRGIRITEIISTQDRTE